VVPPHNILARLPKPRLTAPDLPRVPESRVRIASGFVRLLPRRRRRLLSNWRDPSGVRSSKIRSGTTPGEGDIDRREGRLRWQTICMAF